MFSVVRMSQGLMFVIICLSAISGISQNTHKGGIALYEKSNVSEKMEEEWPVFMRDLQNAYSKVEFILKFHEANSEFRISAGKDVRPHILSFATALGGGRGTYFIRNSENKSFQYRSAYGNNYLIKKPISELDWQLTDSTRIINGYTCYQATTIKTVQDANRVYSERPVQAWYSPDLPYGHGPIGYGNLPGLILELQEGFVRYQLKEVNLKDKVQLQEIPSTSVIITEAEFEKLAMEKGGGQN